MKTISVKKVMKAPWRHLRNFDYTNLSFLYISCLITIGFVCTIFRLSGHYVNVSQTGALETIRQIDGQRDRAAELERLIAFAQNREAPHFEVTSRQIVDVYRRLAENQAVILAKAQTLKEACVQRQCINLFRERHLPLSADTLEAQLVGTGQANDEQKLILQKILDATVRYHLVLRDFVQTSYDNVLAKNDLYMSLDLLAYFALLLLLVIQAVYIFRAGD